MRNSVLLLLGALLTCPLADTEAQTRTSIREASHTSYGKRAGHNFAKNSQPWHCYDGCPASKSSRPIAFGLFNDCDDTACGCEQNCGCDTPDDCGCETPLSCGSRSGLGCDLPNLLSDILTGLFSCDRCRSGSCASVDCSQSECGCDEAPQPNCGCDNARPLNADIRQHPTELLSDPFEDDPEPSPLPLQEARRKAAPMNKLATRGVTGKSVDRLRKRLPQSVLKGNQTVAEPNLISNLAPKTQRKLDTKGNVHRAQQQPAMKQSSQQTPSIRKTILKKKQKDIPKVRVVNREETNLAVIPVNPLRSR